MGFKDTFVFLDEHKKKANKIVDLFLEDTVDKNYEGVICICGISGCGKSEVAWWVNRLLYKHGISSHVVNLDRFYKIPVEKRQGWRRKTGIIGPSEMDWQKIGAEISRYQKNNIKVLIFEGLYAGYIGGSVFYLEASIEGTEDFRKFRNKEDEEDPWRAFVIGEEFSAISEARQNYRFIIEEE